VPASLANTTACLTGEGTLAIATSNFVWLLH